MKERKVRDLMVPLSEYATVSQESTLAEAVTALEKAQLKFDQHRYKHRAVLVYDQSGKIVGKLSQNDIIRGLEPGYQKITDGRFTHWGLSRDFIKSMMDSQNLWSGALDNICQKAQDIKVKDIMYTPIDAEFTDADDTLGAAIHQLVIGRHQSLLVLENKEVIGILRLTDLFAEIARGIKECQL